MTGATGPSGPPGPGPGPSGPLNVDYTIPGSLSIPVPDVGVASRGALLSIRDRVREIKTDSLEQILERRSQMSAELRGGVVPEPCRGCSIANHVVGKRSSTRQLPVIR